MIADVTLRININKLECKWKKVGGYGYDVISININKLECKFC